MPFGNPAPQGFGPQGFGHPGFGPQGPMPGSMPQPMMGSPMMGAPMMPMFGGSDVRLDPQLLIEEIHKCGRGLQAVAEEIDGPDNHAQYRAQLMATRYLFYALGLLHSRGFVLPMDVEGAGASESGTKGCACRCAGQMLERFARAQIHPRPVAFEMGEMVRRLRECWDQLAKW